MQLFFFVCLSSPSVALGEDGLPRVPFFPECHALLGTRGRPPSPSAILPRVQHSGKSGFPECPIFGTRGSVWHSGKIASPVVSSSSWKKIPLVERRKVVEKDPTCCGNCPLQAPQQRRSRSLVGRELRETLSLLLHVV
jgi:hypothetical protein